jgi:23S rRNA (cytidine2498-2'-O)-methyltransferase
LVERQRSMLPSLQRAAWRRGVVTFRLPADGPFPDDFFPELVFARSCCRCFGQVQGADDTARLEAALALAGPGPWQAVHVWRREPRIGVDTATLAARLAARTGGVAGTARPGDAVLDCLVDSPERWWIGWHRASSSPPSQWPGGEYASPLHAEAAKKVSRAWLKLDEAIAIFRLPLSSGQQAIELGCAPGGASQRLLEAGLDVIGIDPALVDPEVAAHPRFRQLRMRARDVKLREFRSCDWLVCDMNIDPTSTMEAIGRIVTGLRGRSAGGLRGTYAGGLRGAYTGGLRGAYTGGLRGIIATLKLPDWTRAASLSGWLETFNAWGFSPAARQLSSGGREVCVVALPRS